MENMTLLYDILSTNLGYLYGFLGKATRLRSLMKNVF